jgi:hypothetical protein
MSIKRFGKSRGGSGEEIFTLDEGRVMITFPDQLSGASLRDLKEYLDIFYRKACRLTDDPVDEVDPQLFETRPRVVPAAE